MTPLTRLVWIPFVATLAASPAAAAVPVAANCSVDPVVVGDSNGMPIINPFRVIVRDALNLPIPNSSVIVGFVGATRAYQVQNPPLAVTCPYIVRTTDPAGVANFAGIRFGGFANAPILDVRADGVFLGTVLARSTDLNASGATDIVDFNIFRNNFLFAPASQETDFDRTGFTDIGDLSIFRQVFLNDIPGTTCP